MNREIAFRIERTISGFDAFKTLSCIVYMAGDGKIIGLPFDDQPVAASW
jgi:hypothetical protein